MNNRFKVLGINDDRDFCEICGKVELKKVVWLEEYKKINKEIIKLIDSKPKTQKK